MAYESVKAVHIDAQLGGRPMDSEKTIGLRWDVVRYLESQGVTNLLLRSHRRKAELILQKWADHPELIRLSSRGLIEFYLR